MKTLFLSFFLMTVSSISAQTIDQLKKENLKLKEDVVITKNMADYLIEELDYCRSLDSSDAKVSPFNTNFEIKVLSCIGITKSQEVVIELVYTNRTTNKELSSRSNGMFAVDAIGNTYPVINDQYSSILYTNVETKIVYKVKNIMPGTDRFQIVSLLSLVTNPREGTNDKPTNTEIRNLKITWVN
jgi:hypothetical protein